MSKKKRIIIIVCVLLLFGAVSESSSSKRDMIDMIGLTEEQVHKRHGKPERIESAGGVSFGYYDGAAYSTRLDGMVTAVTLTGGDRNVLGISIGDKEKVVAEAMEKANVFFVAQDMVAEDGEQMLEQDYKKTVGDTEYSFHVYLDENDRVGKITVIAK